MSNQPFKSSFHDEEHHEHELEDYIMYYINGVVSTVTDPTYCNRHSAVEGPPAGRARSSSRPCTGAVCQPAVQI